MRIKSWRFYFSLYKEVSVKVLFSGCAGNVVVIGMKIEVGKQSSNLSLVYYIYFLTSALGRGMNQSFFSISYRLNYSGVGL